MPRALSDDLRLRVVAAYRSGETAESVGLRFSISPRSVYRWDALERSSGSVGAGYARCGRTGKIEDEEAFAAFAQVHEHSTLARMAAAWPEPVSEMTMSRMLRKIGWSRKKRPSATSSATKRNARLS